MTLSVDVRHRLGGFHLEARFQSSGRLIALFGHSGSGKTSLVNIISGLMRPDEGQISVEGTVLVDRARRVFLPPHKRRIGYVFQDARLFPHMTVSQNLRYGRWFVPASERYAEMESVVELLGIRHLMERRPEALSGGEKQRVAIGRALIASPRLMLMDEPLAALDDARKAEILPYIERLRDETRIPIVYVSHSVAEVSRLATDVVLMAGGRSVAQGAAADVLAQHDLLPPGERAEAGALVELTVVGQDATYGLTVLRSSSGEWMLPRIDAPEGAIVRARVRARDIMLTLDRPTGISALNVLSTVVTAIEDGAGADAIVTLACGQDRLFARVTRRSVALLGLAPGKAVFAVVKAVTFDGNPIAHFQKVAAPT